MSPSDCAWLHAPGSEQTLRLPVNHRFSNRNDLSMLFGDCYLHSGSGGSKAPPKFVGAKILLLFLIICARQKQNKRFMFI